jgi:hypothetical protein
MARISGRIRIAAPVERVFDTAADSRNEPSFNPAMTGVELLTPLPIGRGTRFRARMGTAGGEMLVELTEFDRPHRLIDGQLILVLDVKAGPSTPYALVPEPGLRDKPEFYVRRGASTHRAQSNDLREAVARSIPDRANSRTTPFGPW